MNYGCSDDGGKVQLNNQREAASRHSSISSYRPTPGSRRAASASLYSAVAADVIVSRDTRKPAVGRCRQDSVSVAGGGGGVVALAGGNVRAQTSVGSASLDEYQHNVSEYQHNDET